MTACEGSTRDMGQAQKLREMLRTSVANDWDCPSAPVVCWAPDRPADTAPAAAIAAEVTVEAFGGAAVSAAGTGDAAFLSGGLKYTGKGFPPIGLPFSSMLSYGNQKLKALVLRSGVAVGLKKQSPEKLHVESPRKTSMSWRV